MIIITVIESSKQIISGIPEHIIVTVDQACNVFYTIDGTQPDPSGVSLTTMILETEPENHQRGTVFLPRTSSILSLNVLAVGIPESNTGVFYRRYGLEERNINVGVNRVRDVRSNGQGFINTASDNVATSGELIAADGYTEGTATLHTITEEGHDGFISQYYVAESGTKTTIPVAEYDHVIGYGDGGESIATTTLTPAEGLDAFKLSDEGTTFIDSGDKTAAIYDYKNIDPRSTTVIDSDGDGLEVVPVQDEKPGPTDFDYGPENAGDPFTGSGGVFNPRALWIQMDGRIDGYMNGKPISPGDRVIINKPYGQLRFIEKKQDLGEAIRTSPGYVSGGLVTPIYDYKRGQAAFYYWDSHDNRWLLSIEKITPPKYELVARRNGKVVGQIFKWINNKRQVLPG